MSKSKRGRSKTRPATKKQAHPLHYHAFLMKVVSVLLVGMIGLSSLYSLTSRPAARLSGAGATSHLRLSHHPSHAVAAAPKPAPAPVSAPVAAAPVRAAAVPPPAPVPKPAPIVTPAPTSSVSHLQPVAPPADSGTPTSGSSGSSTAPSSTSSTSSSSGSTSSSSGTGDTSSSTAASDPAPVYTSLNWSGYLAASAKRYTSISASWVAPTPTGNGSTDTADATWIGIGGVTSDDLIQIGTDNTVDAKGRVYTEAFYELLPDASQTVPGVHVSPGDSITASITEAASGQWTMTLTDTTAGQSFTTTVAYTSTYSSVEWIEEDPSYASGGLVPFDNFAKVSFTAGSTVADGKTIDIYDADSQSIALVDSNGRILASPSALTSDGAGFSVTRKYP